MVAIIIVAIFIFIFYFLASFNTLKVEHRLIFISFFLATTFILRFLINPSINKDYFGYFELFDYTIPSTFLSFLLEEPYLDLVYFFFSLFTNDKATIFLGIYWLNLLIVNAFFVWILTRKDVQMWKKVVLFSLFYFLFAFVLIRNSPAYILFACYFYYSYRNIKFNLVLFTPLMHISSIGVLVTYLHKKKNYYLFLLLFSIVGILVLFFILPSFLNFVSLELVVSKVNTYSAEMQEVSVFHKVYFFVISSIVITTAFVYKKKIFHPIMMTTILFYYISFLINPVVGFRIVPYLFFSILFFNYDGYYNTSYTRVFNIICFLMFPYFLYTLIDTHYL
jgi:hypothetical protein